MLLDINYYNLEKLKEAIEIFKLNVAKFPESGNVYDSLGEAYLALGNKELALLNYKKAIALDPSNENGKKIIEETIQKVKVIYFIKYNGIIPKAFHYIF